MMNRTFSANHTARDALALRLKGQGPNKKRKTQAPF